MKTTMSSSLSIPLRLRWLSEEVIMTVDKMEEIIVRRFRVERSLSGVIERVYVQVQPRRKSDSGWRLIWTAKQARRGRYYNIWDALRPDDVVPPIDSEAQSAPPEYKLIEGNAR
jgi:hypothetical protein